MSAAGPPQGAQPPPGERREAALGGGHPAARLSVRGLAVAIGGRTLCEGLDFDVEPGSCWAIVGPNGAGKTTLLATLAGLRAPAAGTIAYDGEPLAALSARSRATKRGLLQQDSVDYFPATALEIALIGRHPHLGRLQWESTADIDCARGALARFGVAGFEARDVRTLSGGERRRVALAALVAQDPDLLLLDEPSSHLDLGQQVAALDALAALVGQRGKALVMALHDLHLALRYADHAIALGGGRALGGPAADVLTVDVLSPLFGRTLADVGAGRTRTLLPG